MKVEEDQVYKAEKLIEDQATEIQKLKTCLEKVCVNISYMIWYMKSSGYQNMERCNPEYEIYLEAKECLETIKRRMDNENLDS